jgi:uncharacterized glyoxalase superfamily protein PhnB
MSFAYFQGQEPEALAYYERRLQTERDPKVRQEIQELVDKLKKLVEQRQTQTAPDSAPVQHAYQG